MLHHHSAHWPWFHLFSDCLWKRWEHHETGTFASKLSPFSLLRLANPGGVSLVSHFFSFCKAPNKIKVPLCFSAAGRNRHTSAAFSLRLTSEHRCACCHWRSKTRVECKINYDARFSDLPGHACVSSSCLFHNSISFGRTASVHFFSTVQ